MNPGPTVPVVTRFPFTQARSDERVELPLVFDPIIDTNLSMAPGITQVHSLPEIATLQNPERTCKVWRRRIRIFSAITRHLRPSRLPTVTWLAANTWMTQQNAQVSREPGGCADPTEVPPATHQVTGGGPDCPSENRQPFMPRLLVAKCQLESVRHASRGADDR